MTSKPVRDKPGIWRVVLDWLPVLVWMIVIYIFSDQPYSSVKTQEVFGSWNFWARKAAHVGEYLILSALAYRAARQSLAAKRQASTGAGPMSLQQDPNSEGLHTHCFRSPAAKAALLTAVTYAVIDEIHQSIVPGRSAAVEDVGIDCCGALLGVFLAITLSRMTHQHRGRS